MATVTMAAGETFVIGGGTTGTTRVVGSTGVERVIVDGGAGPVTLSSGVEMVDLAGASSAFTYKQVGNSLEVYSGTTLVLTVPLVAGATTPTKLVFSNGAVEAKFDATTGGMTLGGATVSATAAGAVTPTTIDPAVTSNSEGGTPVFSITGSATANEGANATYTVSLSEAQSAAATVNLALTGTASATDITALSSTTVSGTGVTFSGSTLTFAPGATTATITLPVPFDAASDAGETVILTLSSPSTNAGLSTSTAVTTTLAEAGTPTFTITSNATAGTPTQEGKTITFTVTPGSIVTADTTLLVNLTGETVGAVAAKASATDFSSSSATVTFKAGDTAAKTTTVTVVDDSASTGTEGIEGYKASLVNSSTVEVSSVTGLITDPVATLTLSQTPTAGTVDEGSSVTYTVTSDLAAPTGGITVPYTLGGTATVVKDYTGSTTTTGNITIAAGSKTGTLILSTVADNTTETGGENITVTLGTPSSGVVGGSNTATTTVNDTSVGLGAAEIALSASATAVDEGGTVTYTVTRGSAVTGSAVVIPYTLSGTTTNGTDYTGSSATGNFTIPVGSTSTTVTLATVADNVTEGSETAILTLGTLPSGTTAASGQGGPVTTTVNDTSVTVTGQTFSLTTATDNISGTAGNDKIIGQWTADATQTIQAADQIAGGAGTDTVTFFGTPSTMPVTMSGIEVLEVATAAAAALNVSSASGGFTRFNILDATAFNNTVTTGNGVTLGLATAAGAVTAGTVTWAASATDTAAHLVLNGYQYASGITPAALTITGALTTTLNITSTGTTTDAQNKTGAFTGPTTVTSHVITGDKALTYTLAAADAAALNSINASAMTAGGVSVDVSAGTAKAGFTFAGGSGNDKITFADNQFGTTTAGSQIVGGSGTDTLGIKDTALSTTEYARINQVSGFEVLSLEATGATVDISQITSVSKYAVGAGNFTETFNNGKSLTSFTIDNTSGNTGTVTINNAVGETASAVTLDNTAGSSKTLAALAFSGVSTVTLTSSGKAGGGNVITNITNADNSSITVTGALDFSLSGLDATSTGSKVDASTLTGKLTVLGSVKNDVLVGGSAADTIQGATTDTASQADTLTGNSGADTFKFVGSSFANLMASSAGTTAVTRITDFVAGSDKILLDDTGAVSTSITLATAQTISSAADLSAVFSGITAISASVAAGAYSGVVVTVSSGAAAGTYLYINDATAAVSNTADMLINITGISGTLSASDFSLA